MQNTELVSIIIPVYNAARTIDKAVKSALVQTYKNIEVILVDDASTDSGLDIIRSIKDSRIRIFQHSSNKGEGAARNLGFDKARGAWIAMLDADDLWRPDRLERLLTLSAGSDENLMLADTVIYCFETGDNLKPWRSAWKKKDFKLIHKNNPLNLEHYLRLTSLLIQPLIPTRIIEQYSLRQSQRVYAADTEFNIRLFKLGLKLKIEMQPLYWYRRAPHAASDNPMRATLFKDMYLHLLNDLKFSPIERELILKRVRKLEILEQYLPFAYELKHKNFYSAAQHLAHNPWLSAELAKRLPGSIWRRMYFKLK